MHIGASMIRAKNMLKTEYRGVVVCASGLGTSTYLASQLRNEMPNLEIVAVISANQIQEWLKENGPVNIFISTIDFPPLKNENIVTVSPFLRKEDLSRIQNALKNVPKKERSKEKEEIKENQQISMMSLARYGEAMVQILRNVKVIDNVKVDKPILSNLLSNIKNSRIVCQYPILIDDIQRREQQGSFVLNHLAMIHARSEGVSELLICIFRMGEFVKWRRDDDKEQKINTFLLLVAPKDAPKEHIKMISEISAMLVEESFITVLEEAPINDVRSTLDDVLSKAYATKAKDTLKGL
jgi:mannitol operon transcriptional antiterminator